MSIDKKLQEIINKIVKEHRPEKIILFGSYARGNPGPDSDVDLFIIKETTNTRETARSINRLLFPRPFPIDLIVYTPEQLKKRMNIEDFFVSDIINKGKILYEK